MKILFYILLVFMISCEKHEVQDCEFNKTYMLRFSNSDLRVSVLSINNENHDVSKIRYGKFTVPINSNIYIIYKIAYRNEDTKIHYKDTVSYMTGSPNACAVYNYYW